VTLIEPGVIRTNFEATAVQTLNTFAQSPFGAAVEKYQQLSGLADRLASNPIIIAKAIARPSEARRPAARSVAPFTTNFVVAFARVAPTRVWDWAMRKVGFLTPKALRLTPRDAATHMPLVPYAPVAQARETRAAMN